MIPILTVIILVITALFGAVMLSRFKHPYKESDPFECGLKPFKNEKNQHTIDVQTAILFLCIESLIVILILIKNFS